MTVKSQMAEVLVPSLCDGHWKASQSGTAIGNKQWVHDRTHVAGIYVRVSAVCMGCLNSVTP